VETVLVTGAGGYIGSTLCAVLLEVGYRVIGLDRYYFVLDLLRDLIANPNFKPVVHDEREVSEEHLEGVAAVCDLAALSNDPSSEERYVLEAVARSTEQQNWRV